VAWSTDSVADKSILPCLEPCALLLDAARRAAKEIADAKAGAPH